jgi:hypothetical protein
MSCHLRACLGAQVETNTVEITCNLDQTTATTGVATKHLMVVKLLIGFSLHRPVGRPQTLNPV